MGKTKARWAPPSAGLLGRDAWDGSLAQGSCPLPPHRWLAGQESLRARGLTKPLAELEPKGALLAMTSFLVSAPIGPPLRPNFRRTQRAMGHKTLLTQRES